MSLTHATARGTRPYQEDRFLIKEVKLAQDAGVFLAVMDGHGGDDASSFCADFMDRTAIAIATKDKKVVGQGETMKIFQLLSEQTSEMRSGSTLSLAFVSYQHNKVIVGVLGDSPVIIKDSEGRVNISPEHNARTNMTEREAALGRGACYDGGYIWDPLGNHGLQMTRCLGDRDLGKFLDRTPEVYSVKLGPESFVAVLSDGIADPGHKNSDPIKAIVSMLQNGASADDLVKDALKRKTGDNVTAIVRRK